MFRFVISIIFYHYSIWSISVNIFLPIDAAVATDYLNATFLSLRTSGMIINNEWSLISNV